VVRGSEVAKLQALEELPVTGRAPLTTAAYQKCSRLLVRGEVKRVMQRGPLVGYFIACPGCGFSASYLDDACGYVEEPAPRFTWPRKLIGIERPPMCFRCKGFICVEGGVLVTRGGAPCST
jgi:hypothetical protein